MMMKAVSEGKEVFEDGSSFSPNGLLGLPSNGSLQMLDSFNLVDESSDQDLLLEVRSNSYFPEAELLPTDITFGAQPCTSSIYGHY